MIYFIVVLYWTNIAETEIRAIPRPRIEITQSLDAACAMAVAQSTAVARIYRITIKTKVCKATAEPDFINCLIDDNQVKIEPGSCRPKAEFIFEGERQ